jgi:hypothetical protein
MKLIKQSEKFKTGIILLAIGIIALTFQNVDTLSSSVLFFILGAIFLGMYLYKTCDSYLIPGCILLGLGIAHFQPSYFINFGNPYFMGLGIGFMLIFFVSRFYTGKGHYWPLIPGVILLGYDLIIQMGSLLQYASKHWPIILIVVGLYFVYAANRNHPPVS